MTETAAGSYRPFPAFDGWAGNFDAAVIDQYAALLTQTRRSVSRESLAAAVRVATRYAAVDTGAIEGLYDVDRGFTRTIATEAAAWSVALKAHGEHVKKIIEDALNAYEFVLDAVTGSAQITESWIRQLHETIGASQETFVVQTPVGRQRQRLPKGEYKTMPNSPTNLSTGRIHHYAPVSDTPAEMGRLVAEMRSPEFLAAHPVVQAAYAHYGSVCVHPFADGNGRVARALASIYLYRSPGVPLVIFADQKADYLDVLEAADRGNASPFVHFIEQRAIDAIEIVRTHVRPTQTPRGRESLRGLAVSLEGRGGLSHVEFDALAARLGSLLRLEVSEQFAALELPVGVSTRLGGAQASSGKPPEGYRRPASADVVFDVTATSSQPAFVQGARRLWVWPARPEQPVADFVVTGRGVSRELTINLREIHPMETEVLKLKVTGWVEEQLDLLFAELRDEVSEALQQHGYIAVGDDVQGRQDEDE